MEWQKRGDNFVLINNNETLVKVYKDTHHKSVFEINDKLYQFKPKGFWNPVYTVTQNGTTILQIKNSWWGGDGQINFTDKAQYTVKISSGNGLKLRFLNGQQELLCYGSKFENRQLKMNFSVGNALIDADKLLILAAVGFITFAPYVAENAGGEDLLIVLSA